MADVPFDATPFLPRSRSLRALRAAAADCRGCPLHAAATQTVFGEGPRTRAHARRRGPRRSARTGRPRLRRAPPGESSTAPSKRPASTARTSTSRTPSSTSSSRSAASGASTRSRAAGARATRGCAPSSTSSPRALVLLGATAGQALLGRVQARRVARSPARLGPRGVRDRDVAPVGDPAHSRRGGAPGGARGSSRATCATSRTALARPVR